MPDSGFFSYIEVIYHYNFCKQKICFRKTPESIFEKNVQKFWKYFQSFKFEKSLMVDEINIM